MNTTIQDSERVVKKKDKMEQTVGQLLLKTLKPDEDIFIWRFEKQRIKSKNRIIIDGEDWTM